MRNLKICIAAPAHAHQYYGGGEVLVDKTAEYLKRKGVDIKLFNPWLDMIENFDLVHFFGSGYFNYELLRTVKSKGVKLVITPMFPTLYGVESVMRKIYHRICSTAPFLKTPPELVRRNIHLADLVVANSDMEKRQILGSLNIKPSDIKVVHCGVDKCFLDADPEIFVNRYKLKDYILCVGRFDTQKNQIGLIRTMRDEGIPMVFVGRSDKGMEGYYSLCKKEAPKNTLFIEALDHNSALLRSCYAACRVFAVPSRYENPGLAAMEAILAGCKRVVMTKGGSTKEYYKDYVTYCNPNSINDIRRVVLSVHNSEPAGDSAREYFKTNYLWENYAANVLEAYKSIL